MLLIQEGGWDITMYNLKLETHCLLCKHKTMKLFICPLMSRVNAPSCHWNDCRMKYTDTSCCFEDFDDLTVCLWLVASIHRSSNWLLLSTICNLLVLQWYKKLQNTMMIEFSIMFTLTVSVYDIFYNFAV